MKNMKWMMTLVIAAAPIWAPTQSAVAGTSESRAVSADIKGYGRGEREDGWHAPRDGRAGDANKTVVTHTVQAPELAAGLTASGLALLIGGVAVMRGHRRS